MVREGFHVSCERALLQPGNPGAHPTPIAAFPPRHFMLATGEGDGPHNGTDSLCWGSTADRPSPTWTPRVICFIEHRPADDLGVRFPLYAPQVLLHPQVLALQERLLWSLAVAVSPRVGPFLIVPPEPVVHVCLQLLQRPVQVLPEQEGSNTWDPQ